uniref:Uncharacterized protein n=1 Tax=uncultured Nocardioidaceae bacterium TaxID=253824 RepID=A0A6J4MEQ0_9ACTN|nr:MAG: hypothetical protein AVDCRST_MAG46-2932 [uncultured Nocardioidaceae bacterium]
MAIFALAVLVLSFIAGVARPETGTAEKAVLVLLIVALVGAAAKVTSLAAAAESWACQAKLAPGRRSKAAPARGAGVGGWQLGPGLVRGG